jgi:heptosyltransferase-2
MVEARPPGPGPGRILVARPRFLGDVILSTPLLSNLRRHFPEAEIDYLTHAAHAPVLRGNPDLDRVWAIAPGGGAPGAARYLRLVRRLRRRRYDWYLDLLFNPRTALLGRWIGAGLRVGGDRPSRRRHYHVIFGHPGKLRSAVGVHLEALRALGYDAREGPTRVVLSDQEVQRGRERLVAAGFDPERPPVLVLPGGRWPSKRWPTGHFARFCDLVRDLEGVPAALLASKVERRIAEETARRAGPAAARLLPSLPLREAAAVVAASRAVVANDGGMLHLAVALGRPTVGIFGPTETDLWFPYEGKGPYRLAYRDIPCRPCHRHECGHTSCLTELPPAAVLEALEAVAS